MGRYLRVLSGLGVWLWLANMSSAHDLASGPHMGFAPKPKPGIGDPSRLLPADLAADARVRLVLNKAKQWPQNYELIVCFMSGTRQAWVRVADAAMEWANHTNLRLNFADMANPRRCSGNNTEHIKIDFLDAGPDSGHWSYIGTDSLPNPVSMNLHGYGRDLLPARVDQREFRRIVLHEFGHALGFEHEHQSPAAQCEAEFKSENVAAWAQRMGWSAADVATNLKQLQPSASLVFSRHDRDSIMHYSLPEEFFENGRNNRCWVPQNYDLSAGDKAFAAGQYPKAVAGLPKDIAGEGTRMRAVPKEGEVIYQAQLVEEYEKALRNRGVLEEHIKQYGGQFRDQVAKNRAGAVPTAPR